MSKKKRGPYYVKPLFKVGESILFRGEVHTVESVHGLDNGNRPKYRVSGNQTIYPEQYLRKVKA